MSEQVTQQIQQIIASQAPIVYLAIGSFAAAISLAGAWAVQSLFMRCKASKIIDYANRHHLTIALIFKTNHVTKITPCKVHPNGYLETLAKGRKEPKHFIPILRTTFSRPTLTQGSENEDLKKEEDKLAVEASEIATMEKNILPPTAIEGSSCFAYLVYDGVACAVTAEALVELGIPSQSVRYNLGPKVELEASTGTIIKKTAYNAVSYLLNIVLPIDPQLVKKHLTKLYDQSTVDGYGQDRWHEGYEAAKKGSEGLNKLVLMGAIAIAICGIVGGIVLKMVG